MTSASRRIRRCCVVRTAVRLRLHLLLSGTCFALGVAAMMTPNAAVATVPDQFAAHPYAPHVAEASQRFGIPELWIWAVMRAESRGNSRAVSPAGAIGLMQIMPGTWSQLSARHDLGSDPFDVRANILGGAAYLRAMWDRYRDVGLMLAAYNAGPGRADDYVAGRRSLPAETVNYVGQIAPGLGMTSVASSAAMPAVISPATAHPWRQAALFTRRGNGQASGNDNAADVHPPRNPPASPSASLPSPNPAPHPLFVSLSPRNP